MKLVSFRSPLQGNMPTLKIDGQEVTVEKGRTVIQACEQLGLEFRDIAIIQDFVLLAHAECVL